jgi:hypothetical protein
MSRTVKERFKPEDLTLLVLCIRWLHFKLSVIIKLRLIDKGKPKFLL